MVSKQSAKKPGQRTSSSVTSCLGSLPNKSCVLGVTHFALPNWLWNDTTYWSSVSSSASAAVWRCGGTRRDRGRRGRGASAVRRESSTSAFPAPVFRPISEDVVFHRINVAGIVRKARNGADAHLVPLQCNCSHTLSTAARCWKRHIAGTSV